MGDLNIQFLIDDKGNKIGAFLSMEQYQQLLEQLEELKDIKDFDEYKKKNEPTIPFNQAIKETYYLIDDLLPTHNSEVSKTTSDSS